MDKPIELNLPEGSKSSEEWLILQDLLKKEATQFLQDNSAELFSLGKDYVNAILFKEIHEYAKIPELTANPTLEEIVEREKILTIRDRMFQLVAKAELEHYETVVALQAKAKLFALQVLKKAGMMGATYLLKIVAGGLI